MQKREYFQKRGFQTYFEISFIHYSANICDVPPCAECALRRSAFVLLFTLPSDSVQEVFLAPPPPPPHPHPPVPDESTA